MIRRLMFAISTIVISSLMFYFWLGDGLAVFVFDELNGLSIKIPLIRLLILIEVVFFLLIWLASLFHWFKNLGNRLRRRQETHTHLSQITQAENICLLMMAEDWQDLEKLIKHSNQTSLRSKQISFLCQARIALANQDTQTALGYCHQLPQTDQSSDAQGWVSQAKLQIEAGIHRHNGAYESLVNVLEESKALHGDSVPLGLSLCQAYVDAGELDKLKIYCDSSRTLTRSDRQQWLGRWCSATMHQLMQQSQTTAAIEFYQQQGKIAKQQAVATCQYVQALLMTNPTQALLTYTQALKQWPNDPELLALVIYFSDPECLTSLTSTLDALIKQEADNDWLLFALAQCHRLQGHVDQALSLLIELSQQSLPPELQGPVKLWTMVLRQGNPLTLTQTSPDDPD